MRKQKAQISCAVTAQLISTFVFATRIVRFLFFLNPKFLSVTAQAGSCRTWSETLEDQFSDVAAQLDCYWTSQKEAEHHYQYKCAIKEGTLFKSVDEKYMYNLDQFFLIQYLHITYFIGALNESIFLDVLHFLMKNITSRDLEATPMCCATPNPASDVVCLLLLV